MIRRVLLISGAGGLVLFHKSFGDDNEALGRDSGLLGGLITALVDFTREKIGTPVVHMRFGNVATSVVDTVVEVKNNKRERLICFLISDPDDGEHFGRLIASELLLAFAEEYGEKLSDMRSAVENFQAQFQDFSKKIHFIVEKSVIPIMKNLEKNPNVKYAVLLKRSVSEIQSGVLERVWYPAAHPNQTGVLAEVQNFLNVADDILSTRRSFIASARVGGRIIVRSLDKAAIVVVCKSAACCSEALPAVERAIALLDNVSAMLDFLRGDR